MSVEPSHRKTLPLAFAALGVVFGDIGTSPLYAFKECMGQGSSPSDIYGIISLILWTLIILVSVKYAGIILRADNDGEGGILTLLSLAFPEKPTASSPRTVALMTSLGLLGAALLYGDGIITPAISVLSSVEGLTLLSPIFSELAVPLTVGILIVLFAIQNKGSGSVGKAFGGVMLLWFGTLAIMGANQVRHQPGILWAVNPYLGVHYLIHHTGIAIVVLGSVFLAVTGGEALYADLGHFGRRPIQFAWNCLVLPALALNYLGQGALVLSHPEAGTNPFFLLAPGWALLPLVILATAATVIASQALISGAFSLTMQGIQMGYLPRMNILHTNESASGQIYVPKVNVALAIACVGLVVSFKSSSALASAYGVAVTLTMLTTTGLFFFVCQRLWQWSVWKAAAICSLFAVVELAFFASNALKVFHGGWLPLCIGAVIFYLMTTWKLGRKVIQEQQLQVGMPLEQFVTSLSSTTSNVKILSERVMGTAVFLTGSLSGTPGALIQNIKHNQVLHERNVVLTIVTDHVPRRENAARMEINSLSNNFYQLVAHFGFMEHPTILEILECAKRQQFLIEAESTSFFLTGLNLVATADKGLPRWREGVFIFMSRTAQKASEYFRMPCDRTIEIDWQVEI